MTQLTWYQSGSGSMSWRKGKAAVYLFTILVILVLYFPLEKNGVYANHDSHQGISLSKRGYLFEDNDAPFTVSYNMYVMLLGLNGDGAHRAVLDADVFQQSLANSFPAGRPYSVVAEEPLHVQYAMNYNVVHADSKLLHRIEQVLADNMEVALDSQGRPLDLSSLVTPGAASSQTGAVSGPVFEIDIQKIEFELNKLIVVEIGTHMTASLSVQQQPAAQFASREHAMLILSPDRYRMAEHLARRAARTSKGSKAVPRLTPGQPWGYRYRYGPGGVPCKQWVASGRYVVMDLSAMSIAFGTTDTTEGSVAHSAIPVLDADNLALVAGEQGQGSVTRPSVSFVAKLTSLALSAIRKVFVSDIMYRRVDYAKKVVVPIVVLRNHDRFDPVANVIGTGGRKGEQTDPAYADMRIDVARIREELRHMLLPSQELIVTSITHSVHDHHGLSTAVFKALKGFSQHAADDKGRYKVSVRPALDSETLLHDVISAAGTDLLLMSMVSNAQVIDPARATKVQLIADEDHKQAIRRLVARKKKQKKQRRGLKGWQKDKFTGKVSPILEQRILPIFVYSLIGLPEDTLLDGAHLAVPSRRGDMVVALQTPNPKVKIPFFSADGPITLNARDPTRDIIAAAVTALGGVVPPYQEFDSIQNRLGTDYMWAVGHHPFGPFSTSPRVSRIFADAVIRNSIVARVSTAVNNVKKAVHELNEFTKDFVSDPRHDEFAKQADASKAISTATWYQRLRSGNILSPLAANVALALASHLEALDAHLISIGPMLENHEWGRATELASALYVSAQAFSATVKSEIAQARDELSCCRKTYVEKAALAGLGSAMLEYTSAAVRTALGGVAAGAAAATRAIADGAESQAGGFSILSWIMIGMWVLVTIIIITVCCTSGTKKKPAHPKPLSSQAEASQFLSNPNSGFGSEPEAMSLRPRAPSAASKPTADQFAPMPPVVPSPLPSAISSTGVPTPVYTPGSTMHDAAAQAEMKASQPTIPAPSTFGHETLAHGGPQQASAAAGTPSAQTLPTLPSLPSVPAAPAQTPTFARPFAQSPGAMSTSLPSPASHAYVPTGAGAGMSSQQQQQQQSRQTPTAPGSLLPGQSPFAVPTPRGAGFPTASPSASGLPGLPSVPAGLPTTSMSDFGRAGGFAPPSLPVPTPRTLPTVPQVPGIPGLPSVPGAVSSTSATPTAAGLPNMSLPGSPSHSQPSVSPALSNPAFRLPQPPSVPQMPTLPQLPSVPTIPVGTPRLPGLPTTPSQQQQQQQQQQHPQLPGRPNLQ